MGFFLWCFTWFWWLNNQKAWKNLLRSSLHFVVAITSHYKRLHMFSMASLKEKGMKSCSFMTRVLRHLQAGGTTHQLHVADPQTRSSAPQCHILCGWEHGTWNWFLSLCVNQHRHKNNDTTMDEMQGIFLLPHQPEYSWGSTWAAAYGWGHRHPTCWSVTQPVVLTCISGICTDIFYCWALIFPTTGQKSWTCLIGDLQIYQRPVFRSKHRCSACPTHNDTCCSTRQLQVTWPCLQFLPIFTILPHFATALGISCSFT